MRTTDQAPASHSLIRSRLARLSTCALATTVLAGCQSTPSEDLWLQLPEPVSFRETSIDSVPDLIEQSDLVVEGTIAKVEVRDRGIWSEPQGPEDLPIFAEDVVLTIRTGETKDASDVEVRIEHLYDEQPGSGPIVETSLKVDARTYIFALIDDENALAVKSDGPGYRCTDEADYCGLTFDDGVLHTTPRQSQASVPLRTLLPDAEALQSFADIQALAGEASVETLG